MSQTNFTSGELSAQMDGRVDFNKYHNGAELLHNFIVRATGGVSRRGGTFFIHGVKDSTKRTYLIPFIFSAAQAYVLEFSPGFIRIYNNRAIVNGAGTGAGPIEVVTPYDANDLPTLRYAQSGDVLYLCSTGTTIRAPRKLLRITATQWELRVVHFDPPPSIEAPFAPAATLTPGTGATVAGTLGVTFTASAAVFLAGDVNKLLTAGAGKAIIRTITGGGASVTADIVDEFSSLAVIASGLWFIFGSPNADLTPSAKSPARSPITLTATVASFRSSDVGSFVRLHGGLTKIVAFTSSTVVSAEIVSVLNAVTAALAGAWTLEVPSWSAARGFPGVVQFYEQRSMWAASHSEPFTIWGSVTGDFENLALGPNDDDALDYALAVGDFDRIRSLVPLRVLLVGTPAAEFNLHGATDTPLTPSSVKAIPETSHGEDFNVQPLRSGHAALFVQRGAQRLLEQAYDFATDAIQATDLSILAEHLFQTGIVGTARQQSPLPYIFAVMNNGVLACCAYQRAENVVAWSRFVTGPSQDLTDGQFESVCVIPNACGSGDEVWVVVARLDENGDTVRFVEVFDGALSTDSALVATSEDGVTPIDTVTGLDHLKGLTVQVVVTEGLFYTMVVPEDGILTLPDKSTSPRIEVGLKYRSRLRTLEPEIPNQEGTSQGRLKRANRFMVRFICTGPGCTVGGETAESRELFTPVGGLRHEDFIRVHLGWDRADRVTVDQEDPFTVTVLLIQREVSVGEGEEG